MIEREGFGDDDVTDLLYLNFKATDKIGHLFSADGVEMSDTLASQDAALAQLVDTWNAQVGEGRWVMVLAADHGTQNDPDLTGAFMISADKLRAELTAEFDDGDEIPLVQKRIIAAANAKARPLVTATQMLESMVEHEHPTRAEVTDIANAVLDGTDPVMLSAESAIGRNPVATGNILRRVIAATHAE